MTTQLATGTPVAARRLVIERRHATRYSLILVALLFSLAATSCGSKSALVAPCRIDFEPVEPQILFVLDASGSTMPSDLTDGSDYASWAWREMTTTVESIAASNERVVAFGAIYFPLHAAYPAPPGGAEVQCAVGSALGVEPRLGAARDLREYLQTAPHAGNSPLTPALHVAVDYVRSHPTSRRRVIVLVTDGIADCNPEPDCETCTCTLGNCCVVPRAGWDCIDDFLPSREIADLRAAGAETAVVGLVQQVPSFVPIQRSALERAAAAGGFGPVAWVSEGGIGAAIEEAVTRARRTCRFHAPQEFGGDRTAIDVGASAVLHDSANGWEWVGDGRSEIELKGDACERYRESGARVSIALVPTACDWRDR